MATRKLDQDDFELGSMNLRLYRRTLVNALDSYKYEQKEQRAHLVAANIQSILTPFKRTEANGVVNAELLLTPFKRTEANGVVNAELLNAYECLEQECLIAIMLKKPWVTLYVVNQVKSITKEIILILDVYPLDEGEYISLIKQLVAMLNYYWVLTNEDKSKIRG